MVLERAQDHMSKVYFGLGGSDANTTNGKLVWYYNNILGRPRKKRSPRWRGYHGSGLVNGSLLSNCSDKFDLPSITYYTTAPYYYRREMIEQIESEFVAQCRGSRNSHRRRKCRAIAAFIGEPALGTGGLVPPPKGYWAAIQSVLERHDIWLIADEVVTGFGRLGSMFGGMHYDLKPDLITMPRLDLGHAFRVRQLMTAQQVLERAPVNLDLSVTAGLCGPSAGALQALKPEPDR